MYCPPPPATRIEPKSQCTVGATENGLTILRIVSSDGRAATARLCDTEVKRLIKLLEATLVNVKC